MGYSYEVMVRGWGARGAGFPNVMHARVVRMTIDPRIPTTEYVEFSPTGQALLAPAGGEGGGTVRLASCACCFSRPRDIGKASRPAAT